ncbi:hypothetical protein EXE83_19515 [Salmonella enterica]|nr:hypothetical protein [Salmonella enterica]
MADEADIASESEQLRTDAASSDHRRKKTIQQPRYLEKTFVFTGFFHNKSIKKRGQVVVFISLFHYLSMRYSKQ